MNLKDLFKRDPDYRAEFLPSALEIIEKPESPLGKVVIWMIFAILTLTILWSIIGQVDEVAEAEGKIVPDGDIKVIQSLEGGVVTAIHVQEGQHVKRGQLLIELDTTINRAELEKQRVDLATARVERTLLQAAQEGNTGKMDQIIKENSGMVIDPEILKRQTELKTIRQQNFAQKQTQLKTAVAQSSAELVMAKSQLKQLATKIKALKDQVDIQTSLYTSGAGPKKDLTEQQNELELTQEQYEQQQAQIAYYEADISAKNSDVALGSVEYQKAIMEELVTKDKAIGELEKEVEKLDKRVSLQTVVAPVDGTVQGVSANTIGGIVSSEKPIVTIVPDDTPLVMEATVLNKDIGFVHSGQSVDIKLDTFPFQRYGSLPGTIVSISPDAEKDEKLGYVYKVKVRPLKNTMHIAENDLPISSGMTAQAELKTGTRRIIEFFVPGMEEIKSGFELR